MDHGRERRVPPAFRDAVRRVLVIVALCAVIVALLQVSDGAAVPLGGSGQAPSVDEAARTAEEAAGFAPAAAPVLTGRLDDAPDGEVSVFVAVGGEGRLVPGANLPLTIEVVNKTDVDVSAGSLVIAFGQDTIDTRAAYSSWLDVADPQQQPASALEVHRAEIDEVGAGEVVEVATEVPASALGLDAETEFGPRGLAVQHVVDGVPTAQGRSTVVVDGIVDAEPTPLTVVVPIVPPTGSPALLDADALAALTGPRGSLTQLLDAVEGTSATLAIDPRLLVSIRALGDDAPALAVEWLDRLLALENDSFELPYADADLTLQQQALDEPLELVDEAFAYESEPDTDTGGDEPDATPSATPGATTTGSAAPTSTGDADDEQTGASGTDDTDGNNGTDAEGTDAPPATDGSADAGETAAPTGTPTPTETTDGDGEQDEAPRLDLAELTEFPYTLEGIAWPNGATLTASGLETTAAWGYTTVLVDEASVERLDDYDFTPHAGLDLDGRTAIAADAQLDAALRLAANARGEADRDAALMQLSTVLAIVARELPYEQRGMFAITEHVAASNPAALGDVLHALEDLPWVAGGSLADLAAAPDAHRATLVPGAHDPAAVDRFEELLVAEARAREYASMLDDEQRFVSTQRADLLATISASRLAEPTSWLASSGAFIAGVAEVEAGVVVTETSDIQLVGRETQLPVFVRNDTDHVVTVQVLLAPTTGRLDAGDPVTLRLTPGAMERAQVPVQAISNGHAVVDVHLLTPDGVLLPSSQSLRVNVQTEWETVTIVVAVVGLATLFVWGLFRTIRRRRGRLADGNEALEPNETNEE